ncbi:MAG: hypothetical protein N7Q72_02400, partial [Spiroplasma sp. Tabriz.8]|nr:hypothetical protein [Spiroplasma sp. Tabriz.8]
NFFFNNYYFYFFSNLAPLFIKFVWINFSISVFRKVVLYIYIYIYIYFNIYDITLDWWMFI